MIFTLKDKVWWFALYSRVFVLIISAIFNFLLPDHAADAFISPKPSNNVQETLGDIVVRHLFGGLVRWDAQYFIHIAMYGYTYENCLAFFPLFPLLCRVMTQVLYLIFGGVLNDFSLYVISSVCINLFCFVKSASVLYDLSIRVLRNESLAYKASIFYCVNPASIFFSAPYSECLYACLTFYGMLKCSCGFKEKFSSNCGIIFGLSAIARSNGILNVGFIVYKCLASFVHETLPRFTQELRNTRIGVLPMMPVMIMMTCVIALPYLLSIIFSLLPFVTYQMYGYQKYCFPYNHNLPDFLVKFAKTNDFILPGSIDEIDEENHWCKMSIPFSYSYVQSHYWDVGFLRYYHWKQIPNFILALPVVWIIFSESYFFILKYYRYCLYLGLVENMKQRKISSEVKTVFHKRAFVLPEDIFPYVIHALFLTIFSVLSVHIQVTTRLVSSSSPVLYWYCAKIACETPKYLNDASKLSTDLSKVFKNKSEAKSDFVQCDIESVENMCSSWKVFILERMPSTYKGIFIYLHFLLFMIVGTIMFSNFLPWT